MSHVNTTMARVAPAVADKVAAKIADKQHYDAKTLDLDGALHRPGGVGQTHGSGRSGPRE